MSSFFSDPYFGRGQTLLSGEAIELNGNSVSPNVSYPVAGQNIVGDVKVFNDVDPRTAQTFSNQLVYCMACRYTGSLVADGSTMAGFAYTLGTDGASFSATKATAADVNAGLRIGIFDEYYTGTLRQYDIVWLTVSGPTMAKCSTAAITAGAAVTLTTSAGTVVQVATNAIPIAGNVAVGNHRGAIRLTTITPTAAGAADLYGNAIPAGATVAADNGKFDIGVGTAANSTSCRIHFTGNSVQGSVL